MRGKRTRCWWCGKRLALPHYTVIVFHGDEYVVHKACKDLIELKPVTAQPRDK